MNPRLAPVGARAHVGRQPPGQRPGVQALVEWHSLGLGAASDLRRAPPPGVAAAAPAAQPGSLAGVAGVAVIAPDRLGWRTAVADPRGDGWFRLGSLAPWAAFDDAVQWFDLVASLQRDGAWHDLPLDLSFDEPGAAAGSRIELAVDSNDLRDLHALGIDPETLREALKLASCTRWAARRDGLGVFVALLIDLGWS